MIVLVIDKRGMVNSAQHIALACEETGRLGQYIRPYGYRNRWWERCLAKNGIFGRRLRNICAHRTMLPGLEQSCISEVPSAFGLVQALFESRRTSTKFSVQVVKQIARTGERFVSAADAVVATNGIALEAFRSAKRSGKITILNHPDPHYVESKNILELEKQKNPEWAHSIWGAGQNWTVEERAVQEYDLSDYIVVGSEFARQTFLNQGVTGTRIIKIPYGSDAASVNGEVRVRRTENTNFVALFAGTVGQRKGVKYLIEAFNREAKDDWELWLAGHDLRNERLRARDPAQTRRFGMVNRSQLAELYASSDVFVFPSLSEGMPLVVGEAMKHGLPVITSDRGGNELVRDGVDGFVVQPNDVDMIAKCLKSLREDVKYRQQLGKNAKQRAAEYTWEQFRQQVKRMFKEIELKN